MLVLSACGASEQDRLLMTQHAQAGTQVVVLASTATRQSARAQTTLDYSATQASLVATQSQFLQATLVQRGFSQESLNALRQSFAVQVLPSATPEANQTPNTPIVTPLSAPMVTPLSAPNITAVPDNAPRLENAGTALKVGTNDCALDNTQIFSPSTPAIYVVATAINVPANTRLSSRWLFRNELVATFDFTPNFDIQRACIWFFATPEDFAFATGEWSVALDINGVQATPNVNFTITGG